MKKICFLICLTVILSIPQTFAQYSYDSVSFEVPTNSIVINNAGGNTWQIGTPSKSFFNASYDGTKAIMTDTVDYYPPNDTSSFIYIIRNPYTQTCFTSMQFWHKYDTDTLEDQGFIEASYDGGNSWVIVDDTSEIGPWGGNYFIWEPDYHAATGEYTEHLLITSGRSDGWILSTFIWQWYIPVDNDTIILNPDSLMIRFTFNSDDVNTDREGWMIDQIVTSSAWWEICSGVGEIQDVEKVSIYPNPFRDQAVIRPEKPLEHAVIQVFDAYGRLVQEARDVSGENYMLSRDRLPQGCYLLLIREPSRFFPVTRFLICD